MWSSPLNLYLCINSLCNLLLSLVSAVKNIHVDVLHVITWLCEICNIEDIVVLFSKDLFKPFVLDWRELDDQQGELQYIWLLHSPVLPYPCVIMQSATLPVFLYVYRLPLIVRDSDVLVFRESLSHKVIYYAWT